jgi:hydroxyacylglutathione hydrolase
MLKITPLPALTGTYDNYIWLLHTEKHAIVVDPGVAEPVLSFLKKHHLQPLAILITHRHHDHINGIKTLTEVYNIPVYGPRLETISGVTELLSEGDIISFEEMGLNLTVLDIPGHTLGHIAYFGNTLLFCGDTLFGCACGKMSEGTPEQYLHSLKHLAALPADTAVYCAHEYTENNIRFARQCEPRNLQLIQRQLEVTELRKNNIPSVPFSLAGELATNPFLRCNQPEIIQSVNDYFQMTLPVKDEVTVFAVLRKWRDQF